MNADVGLNFWLTQWNWQPSIILGSALIISLYTYAVGPLRVKYHLADEFNAAQGVAFVLGVGVIFLSLFSALDKLGDDYLFSAHMVQHLLLTIVGPPLMVVGTPGWLIRPLLRKRAVLRIAKFVTMPFVAFFLYNANFWLWHAPSLYDATLFDQNLHILEHLTFIVFAVIYWWPVLSNSEELPRLSIGGQILYIFLSGMPMVALGAGLTFADPLYTPYMHAPRVWGLSPVTDQQLGALIMWIPGGIFNIVIASILFITWMQQQDARQRIQEAQLYLEEEENEAEMV
jgi:cytochrome c oxidase assembly factor CtaG